MMQREPLTETLTLAMTPRDKALLESMAMERGATLSGTLRRLIREAGDKEVAKRRKNGGGDASRH